MKYIKTAVVIMALFVSSAAADESSAGNADETSTCGTEIDFNSKYLWHGSAYSGGAVLEPSVWVSLKDFTATLWSNYEISENLNEADAVIEYSHETGKFLLEPSLSYYTYYHQPDSTPIIEFSAKISRPLSDKFSLYTSQNFYFLNGDVGDSYFGGLGIDFETGITNSIKLSVSPFAGWGSIIYNRENFGCSKWAFDLISADISLEYAFYGGLYLKPHFTYALIPDKTLIGDDRSNTSAGIAVGAEF